MNMEKINLNGKEYVLAGEQTQENLPKGAYVIVRTYSAGVFCGYLVQQKEKEVVLSEARNIYVWNGALCLSDIASKGLNPEGSKLSNTVRLLTLFEVITVLYCNDFVEKQLKEVEPWKI